MANIVCSCVNCSSELGRFRNSWSRIGNSYFSPVYPPVTYINGFEPTGEVFAKGPDGSAVQNSVLQDLACRKCGTVIGLLCTDAPAEHILTKNQLILRLADMHVLSEQTGEKATISVHEKIPLVAPGTAKKHPAVRRAATLQPMPRQQTPGSMVRKGVASSVNGFMPPPVSNVSGKEMTRLSTWGDDAIKSQQKEIARISGTVNRIEREMASFKDFMTEVRAELEANRITRKTQYESNQEQLVWLQEDLKELRQENGDFQQEVREEELPDIRNQLDQLRQEIDFQDQWTGLPNNNSLPASAEGVKKDLLDIRRKVVEVDNLKVELQRLQKRLYYIEGNRQSSFVFPNTLMKPNRSSNQVGLTMPSMPMGIEQTSQMMLQAPEDVRAPATTIRQGSPLQNPPGAFPDSLIDLTTPSKLINRENNAAVSARAQSRRLSGGAKAGEVAAPKPLKWVYTDIRQWQSVKLAFEAFGLEYPKLGVPHSIRVLEEHVNDSILQNTALASQYGQVKINGNDADVNLPELNTEESQRKRKHDQVEANLQHPAWGGLRKRGRLSEMTAEIANELVNLDSPLISPSPKILEGAVALSRSSVRGSHKLGRDSRLRSLGDQPVHSDLANEGSSNSGTGKLDGSASRAQSNLPSQRGRAQTIRHPSIGRDELQDLQSLGLLSTPAPLSKPRVAISGAGASSKSIEDDQTSVPGAFSNDIMNANATPNTAKAKAKSEIVTGFDPRSDKTRYYKCGPCGNKYRNPSAFKYHKRHSSCNDDPSDRTPWKFECPFCNKQFGWTGLEYHLANVDCSDDKPKNEGGTPTASKGHKWKHVRTVGHNDSQTPSVSAEQKRKEVMAARERLVKDTLERDN